MDPHICLQPSLFLRVLCLQRASNARAPGSSWKNNQDTLCSTMVLTLTLTLFHPCFPCLDYHNTLLSTVIAHCLLQSLFHLILDRPNNFTMDKPPLPLEVDANYKVLLCTVCKYALDPTICFTRLHLKTRHGYVEVLSEDIKSILEPCKALHSLKAEVKPAGSPPDPISMHSDPIAIGPEIHIVKHLHVQAGPSDWWLTLWSVSYRTTFCADKIRFFSASVYTLYTYNSQAKLQKSSAQ